MVTDETYSANLNNSAQLGPATLVDDIFALAIDPRYLVAKRNNARMTLCTEALKLPKGRSIPGWKNTDRQSCLMRTVPL
jgi:hypothetical protein